MLARGWLDGIIVGGPGGGLASAGVPITSTADISAADNLSMIVHRMRFFVHDLAMSS